MGKFSKYFILTRNHCNVSGEKKKKRFCSLVNLNLSLSGLDGMNRAARAVATSISHA